MIIVSEKKTKHNRSIIDWHSLILHCRFFFLIFLLLFCFRWWIEEFVICCSILDTNIFIANISLFAITFSSSSSSNDRLSSPSSSAKSSIVRLFRLELNEDHYNSVERCRFLLPGHFLHVLFVEEFIQCARIEESEENFFVRNFMHFSSIILTLRISSSSDFSSLVLAILRLPPLDHCFLLQVLVQEKVVEVDCRMFSIESSV